MVRATVIKVGVLRWVGEGGPAAGCSQGPHWEDHPCPEEGHLRLLSGPHFQLVVRQGLRCRAESSGPRVLLSLLLLQPLDPFGDFYHEHITGKKLPMATQESPAPLQGTECILHQASPQLKSQSPNPQDTLGAHQEGEGGGHSHFADELLRPRVQLSHSAGGDTVEGPQLPEHLSRPPPATSVPEGLGHCLGPGEGATLCRPFRKPKSFTEEMQGPGCGGSAIQTEIILCVAWVARQRSSSPAKLLTPCRGSQELCPSPPFPFLL